MFDTLQYVASEISENFRDMYWWRSRIQHRVNGPVQRALYPDTQSMNVLTADWDVLVVADACRADLYEEAKTNISFDRYSVVKSNASATPEWLHRTFTEVYGDIVYVTGNPMVSLHKPNAFHELVESWRRHMDPKTGVIPADKVTQDAIETVGEFPDKRIIVHYMQPHFPFVRDEQLQFAQWHTFSEAFDEFEGVSGGRDANVSDVWGALAKGLVNYGNVWAGYRRNLEYVLEAIEPLLAELDTRVIVTSDHGNLAGERMWPIPIRGYGHVDGLRQRELVDVPFGIIEASGDRPNVVEGDVQSRSDASSEVITSRLEALGYA